MDEGLDRAREAHRRQAWADAFARFSAVDEVEPLGPADLELAAEAADLAGRGDDAIRLLRRAYQANADTGAIGPALRCAYWLSKTLSWGGEFAQAGAWMARARRLAEADPDCLEQAYLQLYEAEQLARTRAFAEMVPASEGLVQAAVSGSDADLAAAALMMSGGALIAAGRMAPGLAQLDEAMVAAAGGDLSARATGMIYCVAIGICQELQELHRAREWSQALSDWCAAQPEFTGAYRGLCRVHRVVLLRLRGGWPTALGEARLACTQLTAGYGEMVAGAAFYELAELHRLRGEFAAAEAAYRRASAAGRDPQPGRALLRLAEGDIDAAATSIRRAVSETAGAIPRARGCSLPTSRSAWLPVTSTAPAQLPRSWPTPPQCCGPRSCALWRPRPTAAFCSPAARRNRPSAGYERPRACGSSLARRMRWPGSASRSALPVVPSATGTARRSKRTAPGRPSPSSVLLPTLPGCNRPVRPMF